MRTVSEERSHDDAAVVVPWPRSSAAGVEVLAAERAVDFYHRAVGLHRKAHDEERRLAKGEGDTEERAPGLEVA